MLGGLFLPRFGRMLGRMNSAQPASAADKNARQAGAVKRPGSVVVTGPTGSLGRHAVLAMASRPEWERPFLVLVGRDGARLKEVAAEAEKLGASVETIGADFGRLSDVAAAARRITELVKSGQIPRIDAVIANAGLSSNDTRRASEDGYELTFAVNHLAHAQLIDGLLGVLEAPARIVFLGSNTYHQNLVRKILHVAPAVWRDPVEMARPAPEATEPSLEAGGIAYSNSKLALMYYAHELQRHLPLGVNVIVFEPGFMPGTGLMRDAGAGAQRVAGWVSKLPGISTADTSGVALATVALDPRWANARDGAFVLKDHETPIKDFAKDRSREARLWQATRDLLDAAASPTTEGTAHADRHP